MKRLLNSFIQRTRPILKGLFPRFQMSGLPFLLPLRKALIASSRLTYVDDVLGHKMVLDDRDSLGLSFYRIYEPSETAFFQRIVQSGDTVLDVGANIGYYTLLFAKQAGANGKVYAIEPAPGNFSLLTRNVALNHYTNVVLFNKAVSSSTGKTRLYLSDENRGDHRIYATATPRPSVEVEMVSLDDLLPPETLPHVSVVKMDIQGAEHAALRGMQRLLDRSPAVTLAMEFWPHGLHLAGVKPADTLALLRSWGFSLYTLRESNCDLTPLDEDALLKTATVANEQHANLVCVKQPERIASFLQGEA